MEKKDLISGMLGSEGSYDVDLIDGKVVVTVSYEGAQGSAGFHIKLDLILLMEMAAKKTDNKIDDALVAMLKGMLS